MGVGDGNSWPDTFDTICGCRYDQNSSDIYMLESILKYSILQKQMFVHVLTNRWMVVLQAFNTNHFLSTSSETDGFGD